jgi:ADP-ribose pyrophosphatase YjhB (NUDIX family)
VNPQNRSFCPSCGAETEVVRIEGEPQDFCPSCGEVIWRNSIPWAGVSLVSDEGAIVMIKRGNEPDRGRWSVPAGFLELGEHPRKAAVRELEEESGLVVQSEQLSIAECVTSSHPDGTETFGVVYAGKLRECTGEMAASDDADDIKVTGPSELELATAARHMDFDRHRDLVT